MFETRTRPTTYEEIFEQRADAYQLAMERYPHARDREFQLAVDKAEVGPGDTVCDAPAGGGYLQSYLPDDIGQYLAVETAPDFIGHCPKGTNGRVVESPLHAIGIKDSSVDVLISLTGVHHLEDKMAFYREVERILSPGGRLVLADAEAGSPVDRFLNGFVDEHSSMGHAGEFLDARTAEAVAGCGFQIRSSEVVRYPWSFATREDMGRFCGLLFGIDRAGEELVCKGIEGTLGLMPGPGRVNLAWSLRFIVADRG